MSNDSPAQPEPISTDEVNQQIMGAVQASTDFAFGLTGKLLQPVANGTRLSAGVAIAFEKVAQAASLSIQDVSDYARNVMSVAAVAQGKALAEILAGVNVANAQTAMTAAQGAVTAAIAAVSALGTAQAATVNAFPRA
jgi:hypothetical protein